MEQRVHLYIQAIHRIEDQEILDRGVIDSIEKMENWYTGTLYVKGDTVYIQYIDTELETEDIRTVIKITGQEVTISKYGQVQSKQKFTKGQQHKSYYQTPFGVLPLEIDTLDIMVDFVAVDDGFIQIEYALDIGGERLGTRKVDIRIAPDTMRHVVYKH